jgi:hypothetical protein
MPDILQKLAEDPDLDTYYSFSEEEEAAYFAEIVESAKNDYANFLQYCYSVEPKVFCGLEPVYQALGQDAENNWEDFFLSEYKRLIAEATIATKPFYYIKVLEEIALGEHITVPFNDKVVRLLSDELENPVDAIRHQAAWQLSYWIHEDSRARYQYALDRLKDRLKDQNWKVRWIAHEVLKSDFGYSPEEVKLSLPDRLKGKIPLFGSPYQME